MQTIRLTFSPYGYGRFTKVVRAETATEEDKNDEESMQHTPSASHEESTEE